MERRREKVRIPYCRMKSLLMNRAVAPLSTMAAVSMFRFCSLNVICTRKWDELGFISSAVEMLHEETESYAEVGYIENRCEGTRDAAESGTLTENPVEEP